VGTQAASIISSSLLFGLRHFGALRSFQVGLDFRPVDGGREQLRLCLPSGLAELGVDQLDVRLFNRERYGLAVLDGAVGLYVVALNNLLQPTVLALTLVHKLNVALLKPGVHGDAGDACAFDFLVVSVDDEAVFGFLLGCHHLLRLSDSCQVVSVKSVLQIEVRGRIRRDCLHRRLRKSFFRTLVNDSLAEWLASILSVPVTPASRIRHFLPVLILHGSMLRHIAAR